MSKANRPTPSVHAPSVRDGLCRHVRSKGMIVNIDEDKNQDNSFAARFAAADPNALPFDTTIWWCTMTSKSMGPDDGPCDRSRCIAGRGCFEGADSAGDLQA